MKGLLLIVGTIASCLVSNGVNAFSKEYYEAKGYKFGNDSAGIGSKAAKKPEVKDAKSELHKKTQNLCDPDHLVIQVYNDRHCTDLNEEVSKKQQLTDKQKARFEDCQLLTHGKSLYGKVDCRDNGFNIAVYQNKECTRPAMKGGKAYRQAVFFGRCHREKEGSKFYFVVNKMTPKLDIPEDAGEDKNKTATTNTTANATNSTTSAKNTSSGASSSASSDQTSSDDDSSASTDSTAASSTSKAPASCGKDAKNCTNVTANATAGAGIPPPPQGGSVDVGMDMGFDDGKENVTVNSVSSTRGKGEAPPPPKPKYDDGYSHDKPKHIHVDSTSGSFEEALKDYEKDEALKALKLKEEMEAKKRQEKREFEEKKAAYEKAMKEKEEAARLEREENGEPEPVASRKSVPKGEKEKPEAPSAAPVQKGKSENKKEGYSVSGQDSKNSDKNYQREKALTERKSESLTDELDREFEAGTINDKLYDKKTEKKIIMKAKAKNGLLSKTEQVEADWAAVKHNDYIYHKEKQLTREEVIKMHQEEEEKARLASVRKVAHARYESLGVRQPDTTTSKAMAAICAMSTAMIALLTISQI